ncbi:DUF6545 domain-containing protein [Streptomyces hiroshimensis]
MTGEGGASGRQRWETHSFKALAPQWGELVEVSSDIVLATTNSGEVAEDDADFFLHRRAIEINDGTLTPRAYRTGRVQLATRHALAPSSVKPTRLAGTPWWKRLSSKTPSGQSTAA